MGNTSTMKKILIDQDNALLTAMVTDDLKYFNPILNSLSKAFDDLQMGALTNEVFKDLTTNGITNVATMYQTGLESELDKTGVKNLLLRNQILSGSKKPLEILNAELLKVMDFKPERGSIYRPPLTLEYISFIDSKFIVSEADQARILENYCVIYLETEDEKAFYNTLNTLKDAYNSYLSDVKKYDLDGRIQGHYGLETFLKFEQTQVTIIPDSIKWGVTVSADINNRRAKMRDKQNR